MHTATTVETLVAMISFSMPHIFKLIISYSFLSGVRDCLCEHSCCPACPTSSDYTNLFLGALITYVVDLIAKTRRGKVLRS